MYARDIKTGITVYNQEPVIVNETVATAFVDGKNVLGIKGTLNIFKQ